MKTINARQLSRHTKTVIEDVLRSGRPAIVTVNGRPQVAVTPLVGALEAAEEHLLLHAPAHVQTAVRHGEADLISGKVTVDEAHYASFSAHDATTPPEQVAAVLEEQLPSARELEDSIRSADDASDAASQIREGLARVAVFALGEPAGDISVPGRGTESNLLHFTIKDDDGRELVMLPVFTGPDLMRDALIRNPDWQTLYVLQINGKELLDNFDPDVTIIINPWSDLEFQILPPELAGYRTYVTEPLVAAAELVTA